MKEQWIISCTDDFNGVKLYFTGSPHRSNMWMSNIECAWTFDSWQQAEDYNQKLLNHNAALHMIEKI